VSIKEWVVVALGSNAGDSAAILAAAMDRLERFSGGSMRRSSVWRTAPVDCPVGSADFLNAVVVWLKAGGQTPEALLATLQSLEREFGRRPKRVHNEARTLDLDLIAFGEETRRGPELTLPHPRAAARAFVLGPLAELLPGLVLPGQTRTVGELLAGLGEARRRDRGQ
jgi:2-amino-4-hydroxy-6-hydroxymethyldihydropteridine diphosphokinase